MAPARYAILHGLWLHSLRQECGPFETCQFEQCTRFDTTRSWAARSTRRSRWHYCLSLLAFLQGEHFPLLPFAQSFRQREPRLHSHQDGVEGITTSFHTHARTNWPPARSSKTRKTRRQMKAYHRSRTRRMLLFVRGYQCGSRIRAAS
jgi:hypothetical protein